MVYIALTDRIGNNLFQIATGASLAYRNHTDYAVYVGNFTLPNGEKLENYIEFYKKNILRNINFTKELPSGSIEFVQKGFHYISLPYYDDICIKGYFQSEKFFEEDLVRDLFMIDNKTKEYIDSKYGSLFKEEIVSLHIRRGDYVYRPRRQRLCSLRYYKNAIKYIGKNKKFLVLSDDVLWCKKYFKGPNFIYPEKENALIDLYLQSYCTHNIISNSSFSWWGAWLNNNSQKIVIAPKQWFGKHLNNSDTSDLIPEKWTRLNNPRGIRVILRALWYDVLDNIDRLRGIHKFRG